MNSMAANGGSPSNGAPLDMHPSQRIALGNQDIHVRKGTACRNFQAWAEVLLGFWLGLIGSKKGTTNF
jgi:hypothetical protein